MIKRDSRIGNSVRSLASNGFFHVAGGNVIAKAALFLGTALLARIMSKPDYGTYSYANSLLSFVLIFNGLGAASAMLQIASEQFRDESTANAFIRYGMRAGILFDLVLGALILAIALFVPLPLSGASAVFAFMFAYPLFAFVFEAQTVVMRSRLENRSYAQAMVINALLLAAGMLIGAWALAGRGVVIGQCAAFVLSILFVGLRGGGLSNARNSTSLSNEQRRDFWSIALISALNNGLSLLTSIAGTLILGAITRSEDMVASFQAATVIPNGLAFIPAAVAIFLYPYFSRRQDDPAWCLAAYRKATIALALFNALICVPSILLAPQIVTSLFGAQYASSALPFAILMAGYFFNGTFRVLSGNLLTSQRLLTFNTLTSALSVAIVIIVNALFDLQFGIVSAAVAQAVSLGVVGLIGSWRLIVLFKSKMSARS